jgi:hypothetical protein
MITGKNFISPCSINEPAATSRKLTGNGKPIAVITIIPNKTGKPYSERAESSRSVIESLPGGVRD